MLSWHAFILVGAPDKTCVEISFLTGDNSPSSSESAAASSLLLDSAYAFTSHRCFKHYSWRGSVIRRIITVLLERVYVLKQESHVFTRWGLADVVTGWSRYIKLIRMYQFLGTIFLEILHQHHFRRGDAGRKLPLMVIFLCAPLWLMWLHWPN